MTQLGNSTRFVIMLTESRALEFHVVCKFLTHIWGEFLGGKFYFLGKFPKNK